jgi:hypothetical protein
MNIASRRSKRNGKVVNRLITIQGFGFTSRKTRKTDKGIDWKNWVDQTSEIASEVYNAENNSPELLNKWWEN